jgi:NTP pyrophosphatase (non-canonical NTP hydrolase)
MSDFENICRILIDFRNDRDWKQFHDPKNLSEAISIEAGELLEHFLWKTTTESKNLTAMEVEQIAEEMADILIFLVYLSAELNVDLIASVKKKLILNDKKYPVKESRGTSKKYNR